MQKRPFYISGESYAGLYLPHMAREILTHNGADGVHCNFQGLLVGNPLVDMDARNHGQYGTLAGHDLIPRDLYQQWEEHECWRTALTSPYSTRRGIVPTNSTCDKLTVYFDNITEKAGIDLYGLDFPSCQEDSLA